MATSNNAAGNGAWFRWVMATMLPLFVGAFVYLANAKASCDRVAALEGRVERQDVRLRRIDDTVQAIHREVVRQGAITSPRHP